VLIVILITGFYPFKFADALSHAVDLEKNDHLHTIRLLRTYDIYFSHRHPFIHLAAYILAKITSPCMEEVFVEVTTTTREDWKRIDWDTMGRVFARPNFSHLKRVLVIVNAHKSYADRPNLREGMLNWLAQRLPACHARGIIDVEFR
jgi:hypothetical protein